MTSRRVADRTDTFARFKPIRNKIRKYDSLTLFTLCMNKLKEVEHRGLHEIRGWVPWDLMVLLRWIAIYGDFKGLGKQRDPSLIDLCKLIEDVKRFNDQPDLLHYPEYGVEKLMRAFAFQQFWWQAPLRRQDLGRLWLLFGELPGDHVIVQQFDGITKLTPARFLELAVLLWTFHQKKSGIVSFDQTTFFGLGLPREDWTAFLNATSATPATAGDRYEARSRGIRDPYLQHWDRPPFIRYPIILLGRRYTLVSMKVFEESLRMFMYEALLDQFSSEFSDRFGSRFEQYLRHGLRELGATFHLEKAQRKAFGEQSVADYVVPLGNATLIIEAKATELSPIAHAIPARIVRELRSSVTKGVFQGYAVADAIRRDVDDLYIPNREEIIHLVVTYQPLYLWHGGRAWDEFIGSSVEGKLAAKGIDPAVLPPSNIFFISVEEFDMLVQAAEGDAEQVARILIDAREKNGAEAARAGAGGKAGASPRFSLGMHLRERLENTEPPAYLKEAFERLFDGVAGFYGQDGRRGERA